ncbi:MAG: peptidoglycan-binding protein, partial [Clostridia bacterium]|nr:peptidoglycan-binding protein [Clostridia bacterium]
MKRFCALLLALLLLTLPVLAEDTTAGDLLETDEEARLLVLNDMGPDVKELQTHLAEIGYYTGSITGRYGESTQEAIRAFQKDFDLVVTGQADSATQALLYATLYRPLHVGSSGTDVTRLQTRLTILGYYTGKITGD